MPTLDPPRDAFWIGTRYVQPVLNRVTDGDEAVSVEPRVMDVLAYLAHHAGRVVSRDELLDTVWADLVVNEDALTRAVSEARKLFGDDPRSPAVIETIRGRGYRLIAPVRFDVGPIPELTISGDGASATRATSTVNAPPPPLATQRRRTAAWIAAAVLGLSAVALVLALSQPDDSAPRFAEPVPFTSYPGREVEPALSPEGARVAFAWDSGEGEGFDLYVKQANSEDAFRLTDDPAPEGSPSWSPDGATIAFVRYGESAGLYTVPSLGGEARRVYEPPAPLRAYGVDWSPDARSLVFSMGEAGRADDLWVLDLASGEARAVTQHGEDLVRDMNPRFSPDGRRVAFARSRRAGGQTVIVLTLETGAEQPVGDNQLGIVGLDWLDDATLVVSSFRSGTYGLWQVEVATGAQTWIPTTGVRSYRPTVSTQSGAVVYQSIQYEKNVWRIRLDRPGGDVLGTEPIIASTWYDCEAWMAPDGSRLAFTSARSGGLELWLSGAEGENPVQLTHFGGAFVGNPRWSPDGSRLAFYAAPDGPAAVYLSDTQGGVPERLTPPSWNARVTGWTSDGAGVYFTSDHSGSWQLWRIDAAGGDPVQVTTEGALSAMESADGRFLYVTYPDQDGLWRYALSDGQVVGEADLVLDGLPVVDANNWILHPSGVYYLDRSTGQTMIAFLDLDTGASRLVAEATRIADPSLSVSPDGATLFYGRVERSESDLYTLAPSR